MIDTVTFDVWETMIQDTAALSEERSALRVARMAAILRSAGEGVDEPALRSAYDASWDRCEAVWQTGRELGPPEQVAIVLEGVDPGLLDRLDRPAQEALQDAYVTPIFDRPPLLRDGLGALLQTLVERGIRIGLVCNTGRTPGSAMRKLFRGYGVLDYFEAVAFSNEEAIRKPNPQIFHRVLRQLGKSASSAAHVGDDLVADIGGAKGAGMAAVLIREHVPENAPVAPDAHIRRLAELPGVIERLSNGRARP